MHFRGAPRRLRSRSESAAGRDGAGAFKKSNLRTSSRLLRPAPPHWTPMVATIRRKGFAAIRRRVRAHVIDQKGCDLGCGSIGVKQQCCGKRVCETCALNLVRVRSPVGLATTCQIACPFCRHVRSLTHERVKALMRLRCPSHAKPVEVVGAKQAPAFWFTSHVKSTAATHAGGLSSWHASLACAQRWHGQRSTQWNWSRRGEGA